MDEFVPLSVLALDLEPPTTGWDSFLAARGIRVRPDDLGRPSITREAARRLFVEHRGLRPVLGRWQLGMMRRLRRSGWPVSGLAYLTELTTVSRGSVAAQWARNLNQYRYDQVTAKGRVAVRDVSASQTKNDNLFKVTACIDSSKVNLVDKNGKSVVPPNGPRRVAYDYTVQKDSERWYVIKEKVTETC